MKDVKNVFQKVAQIRKQDILIEKNKTWMVHNSTEISLLKRPLVIVKKSVDADNTMIERE